MTSIVISNYNYGRFLLSCLDSCINQDDCEIIVVDDASTDFSWSLLRSYASKVTVPFRAVLLRENSGGNARGKNVGIALSRGSNIVCLDSDDMLMPKSVCRRVSRLDEYGVDWTHGQAVRINSDLEYHSLLTQFNFSIQQPGKYPAFRYWDRYKKFLTFPENDLSWYKCIEASTVLVRKSVYEKSGLYDEDLKWKIDREMWYRLLMMGFTKSFFSSIVSIYRGHPGQVTKNRKVKDPVLINEKFKQQVYKRSFGVTLENTLMLSNYDYSKYVEEIIENS